MDSDDDLRSAVRGMMLLVLDLQAHIGTLRLALQQKGGITAEDLQAAREEVERRTPYLMMKAQIEASGSKDPLKILQDFEGTIQ
jgi:hypothetical protein